MKIPVFYDSCLQESGTALKLNSQWDVKLTSCLLVWRSCFCTKKNSRSTLPHCNRCFFFSFFFFLSILKDWHQKAEWILKPVTSFHEVHIYVHATIIRVWFEIKLKQNVVFWFKSIAFPSSNIIYIMRFKSFRQQIQPQLVTLNLIQPLKKGLNIKWLSLMTLDVIWNTLKGQIYLGLRAN